MENIETDGKRKSFIRVIIVPITLIVVGIVLILIYSKSNTPERRAARNLEKSIKAIMTFPDPGLDKFHKEQTQTVPANENSGFKIAEAMMVKVQPYFTEKGAEAMLKRWYNYGSFCAGTDWKANIDHVKIKKETTPNTFTFTADLICTHPRKEKEILQISGKSQYDENGLLIYLNVSDESVYEMAVKNEEFNR